jgi:hypothetical protein
MEDEEQPREDVDVDLLCAGLSLLSSKTTAASPQESKGKGQLVEILKLHRWPILPFDQLAQQLFGWRVMNFEDLSVDRKRATLVQLSNWLVSNVTPEDWRRSYIATSRIPRSGYGLFAKRALQVDDEITRYGGMFYATDEEFLNKMGIASFDEATSEYIIRSEHGVMDGELGFHLDEQGRWANTQASEAQCNAEFRWTDDKTEIWMCATRPIAMDEEIYVWYSEDYAQHLYGRSENKKPRIIEGKMCDVCLIKPAKRVCGGCEATHYCSEKCTDTDWYKRGHNENCV